MQILKASDLKNEHVTALIYGVPGSGKTSLLGTLPGKTLIIDVDRGTSVLARDKKADAKKIDESIDVVRLDEDLSNLKNILDTLSTKCDYQNVCVDTLSEFVNGMLGYFGRKGTNDGVPSLQDYGRVNLKLLDYCRQFRALPANIVFTAWEEYAEVIASDGTKYTQIRPMIRGKVVDNVCGLCDIIGRISIGTKKGHEGERFVRLEGDLSIVAKDRIKKRTFCKFEEVI
jgi:phage nucleotide-binding protein